MENVIRTYIIDLFEIQRPMETGNTLLCSRRFGYITVYVVLEYFKARSTDEASPQNILENVE